jgi:hypothetical protein
MPWLAILGCVVFNFTDMELQYVRNGRKHTFHTTLRHQAPTTVMALPVPHQWYVQHGLLHPRLLAMW